MWCSRSGTRRGILSRPTSTGGAARTSTREPAYALENVVDGKSTTEVNVAIEDLVGQGFAVNVHKSADEAQVYVACGDIEEVAQVNPPQD